MVTKRKSPAKAKTRTVYRAAPRKRRTVKTGYDKIAPAMATAAFVAVNVPAIKGAWGAITNNGRAKIGEYPERILAGFTGKGWVNDSYKRFINADSLVKDAAAIAGGYLGGEIIRKFAPTAIKKPIAKIAQKLPKVF